MYIADDFSFRTTVYSLSQQKLSQLVFNLNFCVKRKGTFKNVSAKTLESRAECNLNCRKRIESMNVFLT